MQNVNWKLLAFLAVLGFFRGVFEEQLLTWTGSDWAIDLRHHSTLWFWIGLVLFAPVGTLLFLVVENRLQFPLLRWLVCNFAFAQEAGYAVGAVASGLFTANLASIMLGLAALGVSITIWFFVQRYPASDWEPQYRWRIL